MISLEIKTDSTRALALSELLLEAGALSTSIEDADAGTQYERAQFGEPGAELVPSWQNSQLSALFNDENDVGAILTACATEAGFAVCPEFTLKEIAEQNWVALTQAQFEPIRISDKLWIVPSWHEAPDPLAIVLKLDPGMAFGTGSHPTTRLCLQWLEQKIIPGQPEIAPKTSVLDYGCGSGILAIAAAKLGATDVLGLDIDPQALIAATDNAVRNELSIRFQDAGVPIDQRFDYVVANILSNPLKALAPALCAHVRPGGFLALSGILSEQAEDLIDAYSPFITLEIADSQEGWVCLAGQNGDAS